MVKIVEQSIETSELIDSVVSPGAGGIDIFLGTTRNTSKGKDVLTLYYEAYVPMALKLMGEIEREVRERWKISAITIIHRIGEVPVTEASVGIAVAAPHRKEAFEACRYAIDELKRRVPIWKKEVYKDGAVWVENAEALMKDGGSGEGKRN
ncbi:MAG TPA: molybdenum cofactor biosynthesis protein MoaE [Bacteroidota bacterium]|nr:molybdenum cofactor biosynthesis protein MoaE [Bacteroidota bacterium]